MPSVSRTPSGPRVEPSGSAGPRALEDDLIYEDGVVLRVTSVEQRTSDAQGAGAFYGAPLTALTLDLLNGSRQPLDLTTAVVALSYGDPRKLASPTYERGARDFAGTLSPGSTATATYVFSVPTEELGAVTLTVDFGADHSPAVFSGRVDE
jgi:hypothetical protein